MNQKKHGLKNELVLTRLFLAYLATHLMFHAVNAVAQDPTNVDMASESGARLTASDTDNLTHNARDRRGSSPANKHGSAMYSTSGSNLSSPGPETSSSREYPRLFGMNIGAKNYQDPAYQHAMARLDVVILGFYRGWTVSGKTMTDVIRSIKKQNPDILVGQYTILSESYEKDKRYLPDEDKVYKLDMEDWWLRKADGSKVPATDNNVTKLTNFSEWTRPDFNGDRYPQWLAKRDERAYFQKAPFDIWYFDNVNTRPEARTADWRRNNHDVNQNDTEIASAYRRGQAAEWESAHELEPDLLLMGNVSVGDDLDYPEYRGRLNAAFLEGMMGYDWSIKKWAGWPGMMAYYHRVFKNLAAPAIVGLNVAGRVDDYRFFRFAYTSCLMDNGYFSFTDIKVGYSSVPWFDEYDVRLGHALDGPQTAPWQNGVYRRTFEHGMALVNPTVHVATVNVGSGYRRFSGRQDPETNNGAPADRITIPPEDGIVLVKQ